MLFFFFSLFFSMQYLCSDYELCMLNVKINVCSVLFCSDILWFTDTNKKNKENNVMDKIW